jgi:hypothetical protein
MIQRSKQNLWNPNKYRGFYQENAGVLLIKYRLLCLDFSMEIPSIININPDQLIWQETASSVNPGSSKVPVSKRL